MPVSYTHLDVYKRQVVGVVYAPYLNELFTATKGGGAFLQYASREPERLRVGQKPVSYTHLDVYKRQ